MATHKITTVDQLHTYLYAAMQLEHATIPPYLTALYSLHPSSNPDASHVIRTVVVEEMLHLTLAANILNAVGGTPDLTAADFIPTYPACLPDGETDFQVSRRAFSRDAVQTFLDIERPAQAPHEEKRIVSRDPDSGPHLPASYAVSQAMSGMRYWSIGEFYEEIRRGLVHLHERMGDALFCGEPERQAGPEYYYSGGGDLTAVTDLASAVEAIRLISEQGEGLRGGIYDFAHELSHLHRFEQLMLGRYYQQGDRSGNPTGPPLYVDWDAVYPVKTDVTIDDFPEGSELRTAAIDFNRRYAEFLAFLTKAFNGAPQRLGDAVVEMLRLRDGMQQLMRNPIPGQDGVNGGPTFEVARLLEKVAS
jgi:Ferritin-like